MTPLPTERDFVFSAEGSPPPPGRWEHFSGHERQFLFKIFFDKELQQIVVTTKSVNPALSVHPEFVPLWATLLSDRGTPRKALGTLRSSLILLEPPSDIRKTCSLTPKRPTTLSRNTCPLPSYFTASSDAPSMTATRYAAKLFTDGERETLRNFFSDGKVNRRKIEQLKIESDEFATIWEKLSASGKSWEEASDSLRGCVRIRK